MSTTTKKKEDENGIKQQIAFVKESVNYNIGIIQYIDQKTHLLLGTISILIPLTIGLFNGIDISKSTNEVILGAFGYSITLLVLFIALFFSAGVIIARTPSAPKTIFFGLDIIKESRAIFKQNITSLSLDQQITNLSDQAYTLGSIMKKKFRFYNWALISLFAGVELLIISFITTKNCILSIIFCLLLVLIQGGLFLYFYHKKKE